MIDCIEAIAVPQTATAYVRPSASIFIVEGGKLVLYVVRGREEALRLLAEKRARTRQERYDLSLELIESSVLPERAEASTITVASQAAALIMGATFEVMPKLDALQSLVYAEAPGLDAFVMPWAPEIESGFGVVRMPSGPLLETFHTRRQAADFLKRHEAHIGAAEMEEADDRFSMSPLAVASPRLPEAFGGFAAAVVGARYRLARIINRKMRGLDP
ncbi:MAG TPA: hypothetical protein VJ694_04225 [Patescibacteria group bacterium]|nr:hypothetical protein [Patescibacteria group bacterium]